MVSGVETCMAAWLPRRVGDGDLAIAAGAMADNATSCIDGRRVVFGCDGALLLGSNRLDVLLGRLTLSTP